MDYKLYAFADEAGKMMDLQIAAMKRNGLQGLEIRNVEGTNVSRISLETGCFLCCKFQFIALFV